MLICPESHTQECRQEDALGDPPAQQSQSRRDNRASLDLDAKWVVTTTHPEINKLKSLVRNI